MLFSKNVQQSLSELELSTSSPGTLLHDFDRFLAWVTHEPVPLSKGKKQPVQKWASALNSELAVPDTTTLKRPLTIHYPTVLGLHLLARASGLCRVKLVGANNIQLVLNEPMLTQWRQLTPPERYFSLFEAWLVRGHAHIIGEDLGGRDDRFLGCSGIIFTRQASFSEEPIKQQWLEIIPSKVGTYNLALLKLFGLASLKWADKNQLELLQFTPTGVLLLNACQHRTEILGGLDIPGGCLAELLEENGMEKALEGCRKDVNRLLRLPEDKIFESYLLKISLPGQKCSRSLQVPKEAKLDQLAIEILTAFSFDFDHLYYFDTESIYGVNYRIGHPEIISCCDEYTDATRLMDLSLEVGERIRFVYDLGENWEFDLLVSEGQDQSREQIMLTKQHGLAPSQYQDEHI
ncbi:MAG: IS1096 element passenger TnpR family protein [Endozoicomonas sp.]